MLDKKSDWNIKKKWNKVHSNSPLSHWFYCYANSMEFTEILRNFECKFFFFSSVGTLLMANFKSIYYKRFYLFL